MSCVENVVLGGADIPGAMLPMMASSYDPSRVPADSPKILQ